MEAQGNKRGNANALLNSLADTLAEEEALGDTRGDAHALVDNLAETLAEVEAVTKGEVRGDT